VVDTRDSKSFNGASLVVDDIPLTLNNISTLNDYFSKFGVVVNVQV